MNNKVTIVGLGAMGQAICKVFLSSGFDVTVWNRSKGKSSELLQLGAKEATFIGELLDTNEVIILSLLDYSAMYEVFNSEIAKLKGKTIINLSSDTPAKAREVFKWAEKIGLKYLTGAIMVEPQTLGKEDALVFYSGEQSVFQTHKAMLDLLGISDFIGQEPGFAQLYSIALLNVLFTSSVGIVQSIALLQRSGIQPTKFKPYLDSFLTILPQMIEATPQEAESGIYNGDFNSMKMMAIAMSHVASTSREVGVNPTVTNLIEQIFNKKVEKGYGSHGLTSIIEVLKESKL